MGRSHARALAGSRHVEVACVVDPVDGNAEQVEAPRALLAEEEHPEWDTRHEATHVRCVVHGEK